MLEDADCVILNSSLPAAGGMEMMLRGRMLRVPGRSGLRHANESKKFDLRLEFRSVQSTQKSVLEPRMGTCKRRQDRKEPKCHFKVLWLSWQVVPFIFKAYFSLWKEELPFKEGVRLYQQRRK